MANNEWNNELASQLEQHPKADLFVRHSDDGGRELEVTDVVYDANEDCIEIIVSS